jgi:hypothetical protein
MTRHTWITTRSVCQHTGALHRAAARFPAGDRLALRYKVVAQKLTAVVAQRVRESSRVVPMKICHLWLLAGILVIGWAQAEGGTCTPTYKGVDPTDTIPALGLTFNFLPPESKLIATSPRSAGR